MTARDLARACVRRSPILVGLACVGLALAWAEAHPTRPMLVVDGPTAFRCGTVPRASYGRHPWQIRNIGPGRLKIRVWFTSGHSGFSLWQGQEHIIEPGDRAVVHLTWATPSDGRRPFCAYAILRTNDPDRPEFRLQVIGLSAPDGPPEVRSPPHRRDGSPPPIVARPRPASIIEWEPGPG